MDNLNEMYSFVMKLANACDAYLRDPVDPEKYSVEARETDINVIYTDGDAGRHRSPLSVLLQRLENESKGKIRPVGWLDKRGDPRELILKAADRSHRFLELYARLAGELKHYQVVEFRDNPEWGRITSTVLSIMKKHSAEGFDEMIVALKEEREYVRPN